METLRFLIVSLLAGVALGYTLPQELDLLGMGTGLKNTRTAVTHRQKADSDDSVPLAVKTFIACGYLGLSKTSPVGKDLLHAIDTLELETDSQKEFNGTKYFIANVDRAGVPINGIGICAPKNGIPNHWKSELTKCNRCLRFIRDTFDNTEICIGGIKTYAYMFAYDGSCFLGWQIKNTVGS